MSSISRWYCSVSKEERLKSQFVAIKKPLCSEQSPMLNCPLSMVIATRLEDRLISPTSEIIPAIYVIRNSFLHDFPTLAKSYFLVHHQGMRESGDTPNPAKVLAPLGTRRFLILQPPCAGKKKCLTWHKGSAIMGASITLEIQQYSLWRV